MKHKISIMQQYDFIGNDNIERLQKKYYSQIGKFITSFSALEHSLNIATSQIINDRSHEVGYTIIESLTFYNKIQLFHKMYSGLEAHTNKRNKKMLNSIKEKLKGINTFRNNIVHANWLTITKSNYVR